MQTKRALIPMPPYSTPAPIEAVERVIKHGTMSGPCAIVGCTGWVTLTDPPENTLVTNVPCDMDSTHLHTLYYSPTGGYPSNWSQVSKYEDLHKSHA